jgi:hypothetical protein
MTAISDDGSGPFAGKKQDFLDEFGLESSSPIVASSSSTTHETDDEPPF